MITRLLIISLFGFGIVGRVAAEDTRPNVLFIAVDDLNDWVGCLGGHPDTLTPNIDRLAASGMVFTNAHCTAPLCNPSRASVMTGMMPASSGVHGNQQDWRESPFLKDKPPLGEYFREHGYWTGATGKIFHANHGGECCALTGGHGGLTGLNHRASWTERYPSHQRQLAKPAIPPGQNFNGLDIWHWDWGPLPVNDLQTTDGRDVQWAFRKLREPRPEPFFLAVGIYRPHGPWYVPQKYFKRLSFAETDLPKVLENDLDDVPAVAKRYAQGANSLHRRVTENNQWREAVHAYLANITYADNMVGRVLDELESSPYANNTIVVLWSDHGWHLGEKQRWHKSTLWERATRVPLIIRAPGITKPGQRCSQPVSLVDLYPTLTELCKIPERDDLDGNSLLPQLRDANAERTQPAVTTLAGRHHAVRDTRWRYIRYDDGSEELYDHKNDPHEWTNLASQDKYRDEITRLAKWLPAEVKQYQSPKDEGGFRPLFNGYDLTGWSGAPGFWRAKSGTIIGETTPEQKLDHNSCLVWSGGVVGDFVLRLEYRISGGKPANSGIQYRSRSWPQFGPWALKGYQANCDVALEYTGTLWEERGRGFLAQRGQRVTATKTDEPGSEDSPESKLEVTETLDDVEALTDVVDPDGWNRYEISAYGNRLTQKINDQLMAEVVDNDPNHAAKYGLIGLELRKGPPMKVEFRNIRIKTSGSVPEKAWQTYRFRLPGSIDLPQRAFYEYWYRH